MRQAPSSTRARSRRAALLVMSAVSLTAALLTVPATASTIAHVAPLNVVAASSSEPLPLTATTARLAALHTV